MEFLNTSGFNYAHAKINTQAKRVEVNWETLELTANPVYLNLYGSFCMTYSTTPRHSLTLLLIQASLLLYKFNFFFLAMY